MSAQTIVGVLALQGAFSEHIQLLRQAALLIDQTHGNGLVWRFIEVRTEKELDSCHALIIPGGESTTMSLVAVDSGLLEPLRQFVKVQRKPTWGTCAGLILLAESANRTKRGGQELIGGLDVRVNRNHFGRQTESFQAELDLPFLVSSHAVKNQANKPFRTVFIRAPIVEKILPHVVGIQDAEAERTDTVIAPSREIDTKLCRQGYDQEVEVLARLPKDAAKKRGKEAVQLAEPGGDIVAVRQGNVFGTSFHPELTQDSRIHVWWLEQVLEQSSQRTNR
ncbi:pyridoxine [Pseudovirgaria hyperparasitica]|uniref:glutaminase n=1 Tax=Pseudovirgaria hyperparasitica TaxID=470096 RepID=A0A6A6W6A3_9PEZI|nr:pyridoxine [Pseudovirgaria hyperparasitica]KAF2757719.1 pyridoxine [Pseudovirgaria hyperparasitica]